MWFREVRPRLRGNQNGIRKRRTRSRFPEAEDELARALELGRLTRAPDSPWVVDGTLYYASLLCYLGRADEAHALLDRLEPHLREQPLAQVNLLQVRAEALLEEGENDRARAVLEDSLRLQLEHVGPDDVAAALTMEALARAHAELEEHDQCVDLQRESVRILLAKLGPDEQVVLISRCVLNSYLTSRGREQDLIEAETTLRDVLHRLAGSENIAHVDLGWGTGQLARTVAATGRSEEADDLYLQAITLLEERLGVHAQVGQTLSAYGEFLIDQRRHADAIGVLGRALDMQQQLVGAENPATRITRERLRVARLGVAPSDL